MHVNANCPHAHGAKHGSVAPRFLAININRAYSPANSLNSHSTTMSSHNLLRSYKTIRLLTRASTRRWAANILRNPGSLVGLMPPSFPLPQMEISSAVRKQIDG